MQATLMNQLLLWEAGAQSSWEPLGEFGEHVSAFLSPVPGGWYFHSATLICHWVRA